MGEFWQQLPFIMIGRKEVNYTEQRAEETWIRADFGEHTSLQQALCRNFSHPVLRSYIAFKRIAHSSASLFQTRIATTVAAVYQKAMITLMKPCHPILHGVFIQAPTQTHATRVDKPPPHHAGCVYNVGLLGRM